MSKVLIDRELLERAVYSLELAYETDTPTVRDICAVLATPSGTPEMPVKAYYHEAPNEYGGLNKSVGLEVRKEFTDAPLVLESDAMECIACLEGEIAKRDEELAACRIAVENCEVFRARIAELEDDLKCAHSMLCEVSKSGMVLRAELAAIKAQEPVGWYTEDHLDDKSATTYSKELADRWVAKGWPVFPLYAAPVSEAKAQGVVMPTVDQAMRVVLREMGSSKHIRGTSNWCADVGRAVLDEVARLNAAPAAPAEDAGLVERVSAFLAKGVV